jgi:hypothetical protein
LCQAWFCLAGFFRVNADLEIEKGKVYGDATIIAVGNPAYRNRAMPFEMLYMSMRTADGKS